MSPSPVPWPQWVLETFVENSVIPRVRSRGWSLEVAIQPTALRLRQ